MATVASNEIEIKPHILELVFEFYATAVQQLLCA